MNELSVFYFVPSAERRAVGKQCRWCGDMMLSSERRREVLDVYVFVTSFFSSFLPLSTRAFTLLYWSTVGENETRYAYYIRTLQLCVRDTCFTLYHCHTQWSASRPRTV